MLGFAAPPPLDRADRLRHDAAGLVAAKLDPRARLLEMAGVDFVPGPAGGLSWVSAGLADPDALILLGLDGAGVAHFVAAPAAGAGVDARSRTVMRLLAHLSPAEAAVYAAARSLVDWHARHGCCAVCGAPTRLHRAGWGRQCGACGAEHFPRTDPVVIMLAEYRGRALVARQPQFPPMMFSALAGFVEPGESAEGAVARELHEEAGLVVSDVRYVASQPWPFPSSLMMGFTAVAASDAIVLDTTELQAAMWVSRDEVRSALAGDPAAPFAAPPRLAIARHLLAVWAQG